MPKMKKGTRLYGAGYFTIVRVLRLVAALSLIKCSKHTKLKHPNANIFCDQLGEKAHVSLT